MLVDDREPEWIKTAFFGAHVRRLEIGDIASDSLNTIIERKEINDLASSIIDGRYKNQIATLMNYPTFYVVVGQISDLNRYNKKRSKQVASAIKHIPIKYRIPLIQVDDNDDFIDIVKFIMDKREDMDKELIAIQRVKADPHLRILCSLPKISIKRAKVIREHYTTIADALYYVKEWSDFDGIGDGIVKGCVEALECEGIDAV